MGCAKLILILSSVGLIFFTGCVYASSTIVFDNSGGFFGLNEESSLGLSILGDELELEEYEVKDNLELGVNADAVTPSLLKRANILVIMNSNRRLGETEKDLIREFVEEGGKLLLVCDSPDSAQYMNPLSRRFGVEFLGNYYLGERLVVSLSQEVAGANQVFLFSPIALEPDKEPQIYLPTPKVKAKEWPSRWEMPQEVIKEDAFIFFAGLEYGQGRVAFLGDKDLMLNENIRKADNLPFILNIFNWLTGKGRIFLPAPVYQWSEPEDKSNKIIYKPEELNFSGKGTVALILKNEGEVDQIISFVTPPYLDMTATPRTVYLSVGTERLVRIILNQAEYSISDYIIIERKYNNQIYQDYMPIRVSPKETE